MQIFSESGEGHNLSVYDFQAKHGHDIDCHVLAPASTCSNTPASTCITTRVCMVLNGASTCSNTCASTCITTRASTCITTRASTCHYTCARLLFKNMRPGPIRKCQFGRHTKTAAKNGSNPVRLLKCHVKREKGPTRGPGGPSVTGQGAHVSPRHSVSGAKTKKNKVPVDPPEAVSIPQVTFMF